MLRELTKYFAWERLHEIINEHNIQTYVEVGVWTGKTLLKVSRHDNILIAIGYDPYTEYSEKGKREKKQKRFQKQWDCIYEKTKKLLEGEPNVVLRRLTSSQGAKLHEDESLDMVFIDANHSYEEVKKDIELWLPKIKKGGILAGHDYSLRFGGVIRAVDELLGYENIEVCNKETTIWWYKKKTHSKNNTSKTKSSASKNSTEKE